MACTSCSSGGGCSTTAKGCGSKGSCSSGCTRLNVFDWLQDVELPSDFQGFDMVEIRFKGGRKDFYRNSSRLPLVTGDAVVVDAGSNGWHLGHVSLKGELVRLQMKKKKVPTDSKDIRNILRVATPQDTERWEAVRDLETGTMFRARSVVEELRLKMKLSDVEYQADRTRATFFYSAEDRVDFRDLIKRLADEFRVRVEMRQISLRHEAGRLGGIGSCGRELCCSTWLTDFKSVSTTAARYQNLSLNPAKLSGQCGRLKCCLNYELDTYLDALKDIPQVQRPLITEKGDAFLQKTDIFKKRMWFALKGDNNWVMLSTERVREVQELNKKGEKPESLLAPVKEEEREPEVSAHVEGNLDRLDDKIKAGKRVKRKKKPGTREGRADDATGVAPLAGSATERPERPARSGRPTGNAPKAPAAPAEAGAPDAGAAAEEARRPRGAAARPMNRRNNRGGRSEGGRTEGRGEGRRADAPRPEGTPEARPPRGEGRPPRAANPPAGGENPARSGGEGSSERGSRGGRSSSSRRGGWPRPEGGAAPSAPSAPSAS
ncbi:Cell fate regulator YaaT, PSP1 superfamily (controls sporulation, competence, biofilm development) [Hymenobacter daecheongensis DSM 21074]|uniref:Cell fate regulator YaaT, PSP1 superfamily (Controls sporulation, competence, biofilm development) n=1 Tax=Hymenobacter daecheongensis DSM 21074 TaxID=1121955 RepID=A0A1M6CTM9_9BACT|nr:regulatory iron-sulfur-containing complex subunit RicT [Hymenobacter daecheongensis]SHI64377.1 Cell fate regulator YaaT, PSP1 superfamily (controls sporulation, competence, biofilm development) [Hymenobacter daecheongensis DSM 21074]